MSLSQNTIHHHLSGTWLIFAGSSFGHNLDAVVLKPPAFVLLASGCEVEGTRRASLQEARLQERLAAAQRGEVAGVLTPPTWKVKTLSKLPPSLGCISTEHMLFKNICSEREIPILNENKLKSSKCNDAFSSNIKND